MRRWTVPESPALTIHMVDSFPVMPPALADWAVELADARDTSQALAIAVFDRMGGARYLNQGMSELLGGAAPDRPRHAYLANPEFARLLECREEGLIFKGWLTVSDGHLVTRTLQASVYRKADALLVMGEFDVFELERLGRELARGNQQIQNLQRELIRKNAHLSRALEELRDSEQRYRRIVDNINDPVLVTDCHARILSVNPAFTRVTGYSAEEVYGNRPSLLASSHHSPDFYAAMWQRLLSEGVWRGDIWNRRKNGEVYVQRLTISTVRGESGENLYVAVYNDLTEDRRELERVQFLAHHDALTSLPNRVLLFDRLSEAIRDARRQGQRVGVLFIDLDGFKPINDQCGHEFGDSVLQTYAQRLRGTVRECDTVARLGGDEFVVVLRQIEQLEQAGWVADKVLHGLRMPFTHDERSFALTGSIGVALWPEDGDEAATLLKKADSAMYAVKQSGGAAWLFASTLPVALSLDAR